MFRASFPTFILCAFLWALGAHAELRLAVWTPPGFKYSYVVPVREGESLVQAVARYQAAVNINPDLRRSLFLRPLRLPAGEILPFREGAHEPRALIMANKAADMAQAQTYISAPGEPLRKRGVKSYVLPISADLGLAEAESEELRAKFRREFDLVVATGGDDNHPNLYGREITYAKEPLSMTRDLSEKKVIEDFTKSERGFFLGICRGSQLLGITMGCPLIQDIETELGVGGHRSGFHPAKIDREGSLHLAAIFPGVSELEINTLHHQAVAEGNELLRVIMRDPYGVVEGTELASGRGIGVQFHPELMEDAVKNPFFDYIAEQAKSAYVQRLRSDCEFLYSRVPPVN